MCLEEMLTCNHLLSGHYFVRNLCARHNFPEGSWEFSWFSCLSSEFYEIPLLQWGFAAFNFSRSSTSPTFCLHFFFLFFFHITIKRWMLPAYSDSPLNAEKGWVLLHDSVEDSRINSRIVLFLQNRYNTEVSLWTPNFCVSYAHALILYIVLLRFLPFNNYWPCSSLQRRYKLTDGWMNKPIWKQVR